MKVAKFRCPGCGKELVSTALCIECENKAIAAEEEKAYQRLLNDVSAIIKVSKTKVSKTIEAIQRRMLYSTSSTQRKKRKPMKK